FTPDDLRAWRTASEANICPDGSRVVWSEGGNLWIAPTDGRERRRFTEGAWHDRAPQWSSDGKRIAWISDRGGRLHLRVRPANGTAEREIAGRAQAFSWSPEGDSIAFTAQPEGGSAAQVFVAPSSEGPARQLSRAAHGCAGAPSWLLDGKSLVAACDGAIFSYRVADGAATRLTEDPGIYESPLVSPDGGRIAYLYREPRPQNYVVRKLWVMNADGSRARVLSGTLDRDASDPQWSSEARTVYFLADDRGATHIYAARNDGTLRQVTRKPERLAGFSLADNGRAVSVRSSANEGGDVVTFTVDSVTEPVTLSEPNGPLLADRHIGAVEPLSYASDGNTIQAW